MRRKKKGQYLTVAITCRLVYEPVDARVGNCLSYQRMVYTLEDPGGSSFPEFWILSVPGPVLRSGVCVWVCGGQR